MYILAYIIGGIAALFLASWLWYPAPDLHGVALGLLMAGIALAGSLVAMGIAAAVSRS